MSVLPTRLPTWDGESAMPPDWVSASSFQDWVADQTETTFEMVAIAIAVARRLGVPPHSLVFRVEPDEPVGQGVVAATVSVAGLSDKTLVTGHWEALVVRPVQDGDPSVSLAELDRERAQDVASATARVETWSRIAELTGSADEVPATEAFRLQSIFDAPPSDPRFMLGLQVRFLTPDVRVRFDVFEGSPRRGARVQIIFGKNDTVSLPAALWAPVRF